MSATAGDLTLGPVAFNWPPEVWRDFYFRIADEAPVAAVYLGETICSKRAPLFRPYAHEVATRLAAAGKTVIWSTLAQVVQDVDRRLIESVIADAGEGLVEANDATALPAVNGRAHHIGPFLNAYNERSVAFLAGNGAENVCLPAEMPGTAVAALCKAVRHLDITVEVQVFGRMPLALSARCYHARAHDRTKDSCRYVCEEDADGMVLKTLEGEPFLAVNGIETLSYECLNLANEIPALTAMGVSRFRLAPQTCDIVAVAEAFGALLDGQIDVDEAGRRLDQVKPDMPFANGFFHGRPGSDWQLPAAQ